MAMFGHVALGMAVGRAFWERWLSGQPTVVATTLEQPRTLKLLVTFAVGGALATLPDIDLLFGFPPGTPLGHRGLTHSLFFAAVLGSAFGYVAGFLGPPRRLCMLFGVLALATHGLADTLTDSPNGPALLWPFTAAPVVSPWQPMVSVPLNGDFFGPPGLRMVKRELLLFGGLLVYAWYPRRRPNHSAMRKPANT